MQERCTEFHTLEHVVSRRSDGIVVRTRAVRVKCLDQNKSPTWTGIMAQTPPHGVQRLGKVVFFASVGNTTNRASNASPNFWPLQDSSS